MIRGCDMRNIKKVLLLGDSIRVSYQPVVVELLKTQAEVVGPEENCQFSLYTLSSLNRWISKFGTPDIVHWNNGIHDVGHNPDRCPIQIPLNDYRGNIKHILRELRTTNARIIWATTTPVHPDKPFFIDQWSWRNEEIDQYNNAILALMHMENIPVNDLHSIVASNYDLYLGEDQLHLSEEGKKKCGEAVVAAIQPSLSE